MQTAINSPKTRTPQVRWTASAPAFNEKQDLKLNEQEALKEAIENLASATVQNEAALAQLRRGAGTEGSGETSPYGTGKSAGRKAFAQRGFDVDFV